MAEVSPFDDAAQLYDRVRPAYPEAVFADLADLAGLTAGARIVEIGCGTGMATLQLAEAGYRVTGLEIGEQLAALARRNLASFPDVDIQVADAETWQPGAAGFDAVAAFGAFHWLSPERRYQKAAELLRPGGGLAVVSMVHVQPDDGDPFFDGIADIYVDVLGPGAKEMVTFGRPADPNMIATLSDRVVCEELAASDLFQLPATRRYLWNVDYIAESYLDLLMTVSSYRALEPQARDRLFARLAARVAEQPHGRVRMTFMALLYVAQRI